VLLSFLLLFAELLLVGGHAIAVILAVTGVTAVACILRLLASCCFWRPFNS
jgi:hypothetical protein